MAFDPASLPDRKWLKLSEAVHFIAFGEARDCDEMEKAGYPSDRTYLAELERTLTECLREAQADSTCSDFITVVGEDPCGINLVLPQSSALRACKPCWPPSGRRLHELIVQWEQARTDEDARIAQAEGIIRNALASGHVLFNGEREGCQEDLDVRLFSSLPTITWQIEMIEAPSRKWGMHDGRTLEWTGVSVEVASLVAWINAQKSAVPGQATSAKPTLKDGSKPAIPQRRKPGPRPKFKNTWDSILKSLALDIYAEIGPYDREADVLQTKHIRLIIQRFKRDHKGKKCPSESWFKPMLREIQPELDERIKQRDGDL